MKHLFTFLLVAVSATCFAQGNLQFNQVVNVNGVDNGGNPLTTVTVPAGKVWKITSATWLNEFGGFYTQSLCIGTHLLQGYYNTISVARFPIWLEEGDYDVQWCGTPQTAASRTYAISGIEFNVIP